MSRYRMATHSRTRREGSAQEQLSYLFAKQKGRCHICGEQVEYGGSGPRSAVRFRLGSNFGQKGRVRPRVMTHRECAQKRSDEIQKSVPIEELWFRSGSEQTEWSVPTLNAAQSKET